MSATPAAPVAPAAPEQHSPDRIPSRAIRLPWTSGLRRFSLVAGSSLWTPVSLAVLVFGLDIFTPETVTDLYGLPIFACLGARSSRVPLYTAALITFLMITAFFFPPSPASLFSSKRLTRRALSLLLVWAGVFLTVRRLNSDEIAEKALAAARETAQALREADRHKNEFLATLSHELRNPLAPIRSTAQILATPGLSAEKLQWASGILKRQSDYMARLLDDLLDVGRITQGKLTLRLQMVSLASVAHAALEAARPSLESRNHRLFVNLPAEVRVPADPLRLAQVFANLLENAAKYTDPGGRVEFVGHIENTTLVVSVKDTGIGIPRESLAEIFTMFSQGDGAGSRGERGMGIGLALAKALVELQGGRIEARSEGRGRGSEFIVRLPLAAPGLSGQAPDGDTAPDVAAGRRVLVADDNKDAAESLAMLLTLAGHSVRVAHDGPTAVSVARAFRPEVAVLDIGMPGLDGYGVARLLRQESWGKDILLAAVTGRGREEDRRRSRAAGFAAHLTKPVDADELNCVLGTRSRG